MPAMAREEKVAETKAKAKPAPPHYLVVTFPAQGHISPARHLAQRLLRATPGSRVTLSTAVSACRKMFPENNAAEVELVDGAGIHYAAYSDGHDEGFDREKGDNAAYMRALRLVGAQTLDALLGRFRDEGRPVTRIVYTLLLSWVAAVARAHGVPSALYWIQPATVLAAYFHYLRRTDGVDKAIADAARAGDLWAEVQIPGITAQLRVRDLPSFLISGAVVDDPASSDDPYVMVLAEFLEDLAALAREDDPKVLVNTFDAMEPDAVATLREHGLGVVPVGPLLSFLDAGLGTPAPASNNDLFQQDGKDYMAWLDAQQEGSVVYISFGSLSVMSERQVAEIARGMADSGRPFLWVLRKDNRAGAGIDVDGISEKGGNGMVVEWCEQGKVLGHAAVGCFVTHCGWNSTVESVACGVPAVGVPQWTDQGTNAWLLERIGVGVRAAVSEDDGVLEAEELQRCLAFAASEPVRAQAALWRDKARAAAAQGGSSEKNLRAFMEQAIAPGGGN
ncbi:crocetin glucosyltransferase, chloroplastic [Brachypodium distachyon]|uniref:Glycosyltransferase n=1 Tax=Brachypodium distachyon TaxID=15368 RepID=A0A0Q3MF09_BRADI|nr:crocetin glucosyltransferase, chloroplastic [Brachypodium distachyon]KQK03014.1 hypothetical protein BRADI_2g05042v3 [Brachypodium distachyon]|eukprot:XP_003565425.2 crocetin glucosyltransferase, chloroplastic [Brachypodium distachyon]